MPLDPSSALLASGGLNSVSNFISNEQTAHHNRKLYKQQYNDSLAFWGLQNQYNTPAAQMQRFKDAGLNPNLIYGQGNSGNAVAPQVPQEQPMQFRSLELGRGLEKILQTYDIEMKKAQIDNLRAQNDQIKEQTLLTQTQRTRGQFDLGFETELRDVSADARREKLRQTRTQIDLSMNEDERRAIQSSTSVNEALERIATMQERRKAMPLERGKLRADTQRTTVEIQRLRENIKLLEQQGVMNDLNIGLQKLNINPSDPTYVRMLGRIASDLMETGESSTINWILQQLGW